MSKNIIWLSLIVGSLSIISPSLWAAQIHTDVLANSTVNLSYVSGGQLMSMSLTNNASLKQFVPYSDTNGIAYTCTPSSWLPYLSNPLGQQPLMWSNLSRWLSVSCATQCGPLMWWTAYGDEANSQYCADGSPKTFVAVSWSTDKLHWTCGTSPTQCRAYKGCIIEWHTANSQSIDPIASTVVGQNDVTTVRVAHNKAIQFGNGSSWPYDEESGLLRCVWGKFYHHVGDTSPMCTTPLSYPFLIWPYSQTLTIYSLHPTSDIASATVYWFDGNNIFPSILSIQSSTAYCDSYTGCPSIYAKDPNNSSQWVYSASTWVLGTCPYSGTILSN